LTSVCVSVCLSACEPIDWTARTSDSDHQIRSHCTYRTDLTLLTTNTPHPSPITHSLTHSLIHSLNTRHTLTPSLSLSLTQLTHSMQMHPDQQKTNSLLPKPAGSRRTSNGCVQCKTRKVKVLYSMLRRVHRPRCLLACLLTDVSAMKRVQNASSASNIKSTVALTQKAAVLRVRWPIIHHTTYTNVVLIPTHSATT